MRKLKAHLLATLVVAAMAGLFAQGVFAQADPYNLNIPTDRVNLNLLERGLIWDSWTGRSHAEGANYAWADKKFDYPGFQSGIIQVDIGNYATHHYGMNWSVVALRQSGNGKYPGTEPHPDIDVQGYLNHMETAWSAEEYDTADSVNQYIQPLSNLRYKNGENFHLRVDPLVGEEVVDARWYYNPYYKWNPETAEVDRHFLPIDVKQTLHLWTGSRQDQRYQLEEWTMTNISDTPQLNGKTGDDITLYDVFIMRNYFMSNNRRSTNLLGGHAGGVSKDEDYLWDEDRDMMVIWDGDWKDALSPQDDTYDFVAGRGPEDQGEWAASGFMGIGFIYTQTNQNGQSNYTHNFWNAACEIPGSGTSNPYQGASQWNIVVEGFRTLLALAQNPKDSRYGNVIFSSHITTGPWDVAPGESVSVVAFQGIGGVDLEVAANIDKMATRADIQTGLDSLYLLWDRAQLTTRMAKEPGYAAAGYQGWNMPDPPACPFDFGIEPYFGDLPGNTVVWDDWADDHADADYTGDEALDLTSYTVWRSEYLPMMGWKPLGVVTKKNPAYYDAAAGEYSFVDNDVKIGWSYYYALSASDGGHATWPPNPQAIQDYPDVFPGGAVPPLQSNLQASLNWSINNVTRWQAFRTQRAPGNTIDEVVVFPNPFVMRAGFVNPTDQDGIHFANIPADCEIRIYSIRGDLVAQGPGTIQIEQVGEDEGFKSGEAVWSQLTISEQFVESGLYFYVIESKGGSSSGQKKTGKFVIVR